MLLGGLEPSILRLKASDPNLWNESNFNALYGDRIRIIHFEKVVSYSDLEEESVQG